MAVERILIVEANLSHMKLEKLVLMEKGYDIRTACNADETMKELEEFKPQLVLMGMQLNCVDGFELVRRIKTNSRFDHIVIVAVTAHGMKGDKEMILDAGFDGYILKPIDIKIFPQTIANYLRK